MEPGSIATAWLAESADPATLRQLLSDDAVVRSSDGAVRPSSGSNAAATATTAAASSTSGDLDSILGAALFEHLAHEAVVSHQASPAPTSSAARAGTTPSVHISRRGSVNISFNGSAAPKAAAVAAAPPAAAAAPSRPSPQLGIEARSLAEHNIELRTALGEARASAEAAQRGIAQRLRRAELRTAALVETNAQNARSSHEREEAMISAATVSRERVVDEAERQFAEVLDAKLAEAQRNHAAQSESLRERHAAALNGMERELSNAVEQCALLSRRTAVQREESAAQREADAATIAASAASIAQLEAEQAGWASRVAALADEHATALAALERSLAQSHAAALAELRESHAAELTATAARRRAEVGALAFQGHAELDALTAKHSAELAEASAEHETRLATELSTSRDAMAAQFEESERKMGAHHSLKHEASASATVARETQLRAEFSKRAAAAAVAAQRQLRQHERQFAALKTQLVADLNVRLAASRREAEGEARRAVAAELTAARGEIAALRSELRVAQKQKQKQRRGVKSASSSSAAATPPSHKRAATMSTAFSPSTPVTDAVRRTAQPFSPRDLGHLTRTLGTVSLADFFADIDMDSSGALTLAEFTRAFRRRNISSARMSNLQLAALFQAIDISGTGFIDLSEFVRFVEQHGASVAAASRTPTRAVARSPASKSGRSSSAKRSAHRRSALAVFEAKLDTLTPVQQLVVRLVREMERRNMKPSTTFHYMDRRRHDLLTKGDLGAGVRELLRIELTPPEISLLFTVLDTNKDGRISYAEYKVLDDAPAVLRKLAPAGETLAKRDTHSLRNTLGGNGKIAEATVAKQMSGHQKDIAGIAWRLRVSVHAARIASAGGASMGTSGGLSELFDGADSDGVTFRHFCARIRSAGVTALEVGDTELAWLFMAIDAEGRERLKPVEIRSFVAVLAAETQRAAASGGALPSSVAAELPTFETAGHRVAWTVLSDLSRGEEGEMWVERVRSIFAQMDLDNDDRLAEGEFRMALLGLGVFLEEEQAAALFALLLEPPVAGSEEGTVDYDRFLRLFDLQSIVASAGGAVPPASSVRSATTEYVVLQIRQALGPSRGGAPRLPSLFSGVAGEGAPMTCDDFVAALRRAGVEGSVPSAGELASLFVDVDADADGLVSRDELAACFARAFPAWEG